MTTLRTHFTFRVDTWTPDGESIVEHVAGIVLDGIGEEGYRRSYAEWDHSDHHRHRACGRVRLCCHRRLRDRRAARISAGAARLRVGLPSRHHGRHEHWR